MFFGKRRNYHRSYYYGRRRTKSSGGLGGLIFFIIILAVGAFLAFKILPLLSVGTFGKFDRFNVVLTGSHTVFVSLNITGRDALVVRFPDGLYMPTVTHGYGQYEISKIYAVGELDRRGGEVLQTTVGDFLGVPVDGYVRLSKTADMSNLKSALLSTDFIFKDKGNLDLTSRLKLAYELLGLRFDKVRTINLGDFAETLVLADGSSAQAVDPERIDDILKNQFLESKLDQENLRVAVVNSTPVTGLGNRAARVLTNIGVSIVSVDSTEPTISSCRMTVADKFKTAQTVVRIKDQFLCHSESMVSSGKADVVVVLGQDYADLFTK